MVLKNKTHQTVKTAAPAAVKPSLSSKTASIPKTTSVTSRPGKSVRVYKSVPVKPHRPVKSPKAYQPKSASSRHLRLWQNPIVEYFTSKYPRRQNRSKPPRHKRLERQILTMLAFFSISIGLWENFRQLWLQSNGYSVADVSNIISISSIIGAFGMLLVGKFVKMPHLKKFMTVTLLFRCVNMLILAILNGSELKPLIDFFSITEMFSSALFLISIYPLITMVSKSNSMYSRRKLVEYLFRDIGILIGGVFIGQQMGNFLFDYNACLLLATAFLVVSAIIMWRTNIVITEKSPNTRFSAIKFILRDRIQRFYMVCVFLGELCFGVATGLKMLMLTDSFGFSAGIATNYLLVVGLISDVIGILALRYFTPKNDYITITIKFGIRFVMFALAAISGNSFFCFLALTWVLLSSTAYENITDGYYINAVDNRHQFKYNTVRHVVQYFGTAVGTFLCGQIFHLGPAAIFGLATFAIVFQLAACYYLVYLRTGKKLKHN